MELLMFDYCASQKPFTDFLGRNAHCNSAITDYGALTNFDILSQRAVVESPCNMRSLLNRGGISHGPHFNFGA